MAHATIPEALRAGRSASYLVLLRMGFGMRARSLARRWALTPPFHPCSRYRERSVFCATFRGSPRAAVNGHPALWSPDFPPRITGRPSDSLRLAEIVASQAAHARTDLFRWSTGSGDVSRSDGLMRPYGRSPKTTAVRVRESSVSAGS